MYMSTVIGTLVGSAVLTAAFCIVEIYLGERAALSTRLLQSKPIAFIMAFQMLTSGAYFVLLYELPIYVSKQAECQPA
jgi:hypothetical protein